MKDATDIRSANANIIVLRAADSELLLRHEQVKSRQANVRLNRDESGVNERVRNAIEPSESHEDEYGDVWRPKRKVEESRGQIFGERCS